MKINHTLEQGVNFSFDHFEMIEIYEALKSRVKVYERLLKQTSRCYNIAVNACVYVSQVNDLKLDEDNNDIIEACINISEDMDDYAKKIDSLNSIIRAFKDNQ